MRISESLYTPAFICELSATGSAQVAEVCARATPLSVIQSRVVQRFSFGVRCSLRMWHVRPVRICSGDHAGQVTSDPEAVCACWNQCRRFTI
jgi:hypothetical protein